MIVTTTTLVLPVEDAPTVIVGPPRAVGTLGYRWIGDTGETWDLVDPGGKVSKLKGSTGWGPAEETHFWSDAPSIPGSTHNGSRTGRGRLFLPLLVRGTDSADYLAEKRRFFATLAPDRLGTMVVTTPDAVTRFAHCRCDDRTDDPVNIDPVATIRSKHGIGWAIAEPWWHGEQVSAVFKPDTPLPFFAPPGQTPPAVINIASASSLETGTVDNPGEVGSYPRWRVTAGATGLTGFQVGVADAIVEMAIALTPGRWVEIDMDPRNLTILDDTGADRSANLVDRTFAAIPTGTAIPLTMGITGTGQIELTFPTNYREAW